MKHSVTDRDTEFGMKIKEIMHNIAKKIVISVHYTYMKIRLPKIFNKEYKAGQLRYLSAEDFVIWKNAFMELLCEHYHSNYGFNQRDLLTAFPMAQIEIVRRREPGDPHNPIVVLCVKNDRRRIEMLIEHYRKLGVERFAMVDNGSEDGTFEWILAQDDIDVYKTTDKYSFSIKEAWINRIVSMYGFERWYLLTDSDELVKYVGMEKHRISDVVLFAERNGYDRLEALTFDMYSERGLYAPIDNNSTIEREYCWMDTDSYEDHQKQVGAESVRRIIGGPRMRKMNAQASLMKFPLVFFRPGSLSANAHFPYPYKGLNEVPCVLAIMHYKFLPEDQKEYLRRSETNSGFKRQYYRDYMQVSKEQQTFMYAKSKKYVDSQSLIGMPYLKIISFDK